MLSKFDPYSITKIKLNLRTFLPILLFSDITSNFNRIISKFDLYSSINMKFYRNYIKIWSFTLSLRSNFDIMVSKFNLYTRNIKFLEY